MLAKMTAKMRAGTNSRRRNHMADLPNREDLIEELEYDGNLYFSGGFWNNIIDVSLISLTVIASLVATVLAAMKDEPVAKWVVAGVAAIPAAATSLQRIIGIRERANWYFLHAAQVRGLAKELKYAHDPDLEEFAKKRAALEIDMEKEWLKIGHSGAAPARQGATRTKQKGARARKAPPPR
jgi:hypothetical protein